MKCRYESASLLHIHYVTSRLKPLSFQFMKDFLSYPTFLLNSKIRFQNHTGCWNWRKHWKPLQHVGGRPIRSRSLDSHSVEYWWRFTLEIPKYTILEDMMGGLYMGIIWSSVELYGNNEQRSRSMIFSMRWMKCCDLGMYQISYDHYLEGVDNILYSHLQFCGFQYRCA